MSQTEKDFYLSDANANRQTENTDNLQIIALTYWPSWSVYILSLQTHL